MAVKEYLSQTEPLAQSLDFIKRKCSHDDATSISTASSTIGPVTVLSAAAHSPLSPAPNGITTTIQQSQDNDASFEVFPIFHLLVEQSVNESFSTLQSEKSDDHKVGAISTPIIDLMPFVAHSANSLNSSISGIRHKSLFCSDESEEECILVTDDGSQENSLLFNSVQKRLGNESDNISFPIVDLILPNHTSFDHSKSSNISTCGKKNKTDIFSLESDDENCSCSSIILDDDSLLDLIRATNHTLADHSPSRSLDTDSNTKTRADFLADEDDGLENELIQLKHSEMHIKHEIDHAIDQIAYEHQPTVDWIGEGFYNGICRGGEGDGLCHSNEIYVSPVEKKEEEESFMDGVAHALDKVCCTDKGIK